MTRRHQLQQLQDELTRREKLEESLLARLAEQSERIKELTEQLAEFRRQFFGQKREKIRKMPSVAQALANATPEKSDKAQPTKPRKKRERSGLSEEKVVHEVPEADLVCKHCDGPFRDLGEGEVSYEEEFIPAKLIRRRHVRQRKVCRCGDTIKIAPAPIRVADGVGYGPGLHAHTVVAKCADSIPLYRQSKAHARAGLDIAASSLGDIFHRSAELLRPVYRCMLAAIATDTYVNADETPLQVIAAEQTRRAYVWTFIADDQVAFVFSPTRSGETPRQLLADSTGFLQVDAYSGYNKTCTPQGRQRVGCWAHARRYFFNAGQTDKDLADEAMRQILSLYQVEWDVAAQGLSGSSAHKKIRKQRSGPILRRFKAWLDQQQSLQPPKSTMGKAVSYALNNWDSLNVCLQDAKLPLDNNVSERALRAIALGRKNYLFVGNDAAGENLAVLQSLTASCVLAGVNPQAYFTDVLLRIQDHKSSDIVKLLPKNWKNTVRDA